MKFRFSSSPLRMRMVIETLFAIFIGETLKNFYGQKATDAVLQTWKNYTQGNHDVQRALRQAFCKTPTAIGLGLVQEDWWTRQMQFTPPKLIREFAETIQSRYVQPFCGKDQAKAERLNQIGKEQCKALDQFFKNFPFRDVPTEDVANLLYNLRFVTDANTSCASSANSRKTPCAKHWSRRSNSSRYF